MEDAGRVEGFLIIAAGVLTVVGILLAAVPQPLGQDYRQQGEALSEPHGGSEGASWRLPWGSAP